MTIQPRPGKIWEDRIGQMAKSSRQKLDDGAITESYKADKEQVIQLLNRALASEWTAFMQYWHHYFMATDIHSPEIKQVFKSLAGQELEHIEEIGERIQLLGGVPVDHPKEVLELWPTSVDYGHDLRNMMEEDLIDERVTVSFYEEIIRFCGFDDNGTRALFEEILREEQGHADTLSDILYAYDASTNQRIPSIHEQVMEGRAASPARKGRAA